MTQEFKEFLRVPADVISLLEQQTALSLTSADGVWEGNGSADRANAILVGRLDEINKQIAELAKQHNVEPTICEALGIKTQ